MYLALQNFRRGPKNKNKFSVVRREIEGYAQLPNLRTLMSIGSVNSDKPQFR